LLLLVIDKFSLKSSNSSLFTSIIRWIIWTDPYKTRIFIRLRGRAIILSDVEIWACPSSNTIIQCNTIPVMALIVFSMSLSRSSTWRNSIRVNVTLPFRLRRKGFLLRWIYYVSCLKFIIEESLFCLLLFFKDKRCLLRSDLI
jgi:hypothetical protein